MHYLPSTAQCLTKRSFVVQVMTTIHHSVFTWHRCSSTVVAYRLHCRASICLLQSGWESNYRGLECRSILSCIHLRSTSLSIRSMAGCSFLTMNVADSSSKWDSPSPRRCCRAAQTVRSLYGQSVMQYMRIPEMATNGKQKRSRKHLVPSNVSHVRDSLWPIAHLNRCHEAESLCISMTVMQPTRNIGSMLPLCFHIAL